MQDYAQQENEFQAGIPPRLVSIFYSVFDATRGPKVVFEVPEGSIIPREGTTPIIDFDSISEYVIPKTQLCGHLVVICTDSYKVMGFPVLIEDMKYENSMRSKFMFNLSFVFDRGADTSSYEPVVRKVARVLQTLEIESGFLYDKETKDFMYNIIEQLLEDLNSYCECQIPITPCNTSINLKLFPTYRNPSPVYDYQVPICTVNLKLLMDDNWDITMKKIATRINGIHHVKKIAELADVDYILARKFKPEITKVIEDETIQRECLSYVRKKGTIPPPFAKLFSLYCLLKLGLTLKQWINDNKEISALNIDIRRFISFGVIKGFIYRVHKYPILPENYNPQNPTIAKLRGFLNGKHHYDEICSMEGCSVRELDELLSTEPEVKFILQGKEYVNHIDEDSTNNRASNLEWCTLSENNQHSVSLGLWKQQRTARQIFDDGSFHP
ncbi:2654_t:CDS:2 [Diversispora eburnea]|uniref:2654_t:CDS:1 n=1 Tax=Diversispora eburnea TaxID=1213867 RepID=A0A9N9F0F6_9GLOM|nr:2654_t:CDS:2 [Diversispora eburnea]